MDIRIGIIERVDDIKKSDKKVSPESPCVFLIKVDPKYPQSVNCGDMIPLCWQE